MSKPPLNFNIKADIVVKLLTLSNDLLTIYKVARGFEFISLQQESLMFALSNGTAAISIGHGGWTLFADLRDGSFDRDS